jgi:hypothetical protein
MKILSPISMEKFLENSRENGENPLMINLKKEIRFHIMEGAHWLLEIAQGIEICLDGTHEKSSRVIPDTSFAINSLSFSGVKQMRNREFLDPSRRYF